METRIAIATCVAWIVLLSASGCSSPPPEEAAVDEAAAGETLVCADPKAAGAVTPPPGPTCDNDKLTSYDRLLVLAPHPDDEVLAFAGLIGAYLEQGSRSRLW